jgi:Poly(R)-hydroxyalkanoic acid synthase subunit (PHA_synth_III_E)
MIASDSNQGSRAAYDYWLGLISQLFGQLGVASSPGAAPADFNQLPFPVDQVAKAASITQQSLQSMLQLLVPALQTGMPNLVAQWGKQFAAFPFAQPGNAADANAQSMFAPWLALMPNLAAVMPAMSSALPTIDTLVPQAPLQAINKAWIDMASRLTGTSPAQIDTAFDRTHGAFSDGVGMGPGRKLNAAWRDVVNAGIAQQDARTHYASLLQIAFSQGFQRLLSVLATKGDAGERIDSVLVLIKMLTINIEQVVHETLQSERGLAATAALIRADLTHRKKMQQVAAVFAEQFDMTSRRELDDAFREIQSLKRELRATRIADTGSITDAQRAPARKPRATKKKADKDV